MILQWKAYPINLEDLSSWLAENQPKTDGIVADPDQCLIVEKEPLDQTEKDVIQAYYDSMPDATGFVSIKDKFKQALQAYKESLVIKDMSLFTELDRKVMMNLALTDAEAQSIIDDYYVSS